MRDQAASYPLDGFMSDTMEKIHVSMVKSAAYTAASSLANRFAERVTQTYHATPAQLQVDEDCRKEAAMLLSWAVKHNLPRQEFDSTVEFLVGNMANRDFVEVIATEDEKKELIEFGGETEESLREAEELDNHNKEAKVIQRKAAATDHAGALKLELEHLYTEALGAECGYLRCWMVESLLGKAEKATLAERVRQNGLYKKNKFNVTLKNEALGNLFTLNHAIKTLDVGKQLEECAQARERATARSEETERGLNRF